MSRQLARDILLQCVNARDSLRISLILHPSRISSDRTGPVAAAHISGFRQLHVERAGDHGPGSKRPVGLTLPASFHYRFGLGLYWAWQSRYRDHSHRSMSGCERIAGPKVIIDEYRFNSIDAFA